MVIPNTGPANVYRRLFSDLPSKPEAHVHYDLRVLALRDRPTQFHHISAKADGSGEVVGKSSARKRLTPA